MPGRWGASGLPFLILRPFLRPMILHKPRNPCHQRFLGIIKPAWHAGGQRFESAWLHSVTLLSSRGFLVVQER